MIKRENTRWIRLFSNENFPQVKITGHVNDISYLAGKGLFQQALKLVKIAKKNALKYEFYNQLHELC